MADISQYIREIESASRGEAVRDSIINALNAINESGIDNALTLDGHPSDYFAKWSELESFMNAQKPTSGLVWITPDLWVDGVYSFETEYPSSKYYLEVQPGPHSISTQLDAILAARIVAGSDTLNTIRCVGTVPEVPIELLVFSTRI